MKSPSVSISNFRQGVALWCYAMDIVERMRKRWLLPNVFTYSAAVGALGPGSSWPWACRLLSEMQAGTVATSEVTFLESISAYKVGMRWREVLELQRQATGPSAQNAAVAAMGSCGYWMQAWERYY